MNITAAVEDTFNSSSHETYKGKEAGVDRERFFPIRLLPWLSDLSTDLKNKCHPLLSLFHLSSLTCIGGGRASSDPVLVAQLTAAGAN